MFLEQKFTGDWCGCGCSVDAKHSMRSEGNLRFH